MEKSATALRQRLRDIASTWLLAIVLLVAALVVTYQFVGPAPPRHIVLATGEASGAYHLYGQRLAEILARDGIHLELRTTAGSVENLGLVREGDAVDLAFVQSGIAGPADAESVAAIGTMYLEPLWLFARSDLLLDDLGDLEGNRIAVGARGSGTRAVVLTLLDANGVSETNSQFAEMPSGDMANAFSSGDIDAAFVVGSPAAAAVTDLIEVPGVTLQDMQRAAAYPRRYPFLSTILLPRGVLDFQADRPAQDIHTIAFGAMLVAREDFHPALTDLLLVAAGDVFGGHDLLADAGQFPTPQYVDLPLSEEAERHFDYGPPFLMRYLPFWAATLVDRLWIMLLPLIGPSLTRSTRNGRQLVTSKRCVSASGSSIASRTRPLSRACPAATPTTCTSCDAISISCGGVSAPPHRRSKTDGRYVRALEPHPAAVARNVVGCRAANRTHLPARRRRAASRSNAR
jgi:TRAP transporter TAXI family solute receptor